MGIKTMWEDEALDTFTLREDFSLYNNSTDETIVRFSNADDVRAFWAWLETQVTDIEEKQ